MRQRRARCRIARRLLRGRWPQGQIARLAELESEEAIAQREMATGRLKETQRLQYERELADLRARNEAQQYDTEVAERLRRRRPATTGRLPDDAGRRTTPTASSRVSRLPRESEDAVTPGVRY
ncbi:hypothetical protein [Actinomadura alba]|uniref:Flagellar FliJ protein n=1 Tax=Actinomadura alba TaxID=406431 RepID=A0ABR7LVJ0_9ACTN|nr:hypothetical protein [Actinomadura alba]MBC6468765.1 hypothetical protein [Actinomadura alba]